MDGARYDFKNVRVSVSWKAQVFPDQDSYILYQSGEDDLTLDRVLETFPADLETRGAAVSKPVEPLEDRGFIDVLNSAYRRAPTVYE